MSEFHVVVIEVGKFGKHPNADTLSILQVLGDYPVIFRTGGFETGQKAVYIPVDSIVPDTAEWAFLDGHRRIKAKRLRGIFSMGMLAPIPCTCTGSARPLEKIEVNDNGEIVGNPQIWHKTDCLAVSAKVGDNVQAAMGIEKYEPPEMLSMGGENERDPGFLPVYTDLEGLRRHPHLLIPGEEVVLTEKIHGANARFLFQDDRLWVGSHKCIKRESDTNMWWVLAKKLNLAERLARTPGIAVYGEVYGAVQDLNYGHVKGHTSLVLFDAMDTKTRRYLDYNDFLDLCQTLELPAAPALYQGPWSDDLRSHSEGKSVLYPGNIREGFVVRPMKERFDQLVGRVVLKLVGEGYLTRKGA